MPENLTKSTFYSIIMVQLSYIHAFMITFSITLWTTYIS